MFYIPGSPQKYKKYWGKLRKNAPKVPDLTCPAIDNIIDRLEKSINKKTKAIAVVHYLGVPVDMPKIMTLAKKYNLDTDIIKKI